MALIIVGVMLADGNLLQIVTEKTSVCDFINPKFDLPAYNVSSDGTSSVRSEF